jgi:hypothetical protein
MAAGLESATTASDGHAVVTVRGDIAADTATELWQHLSYLVSQGTSTSCSTWTAWS